MRSSDTRRRIVEFVRKFTKQRGYAPTMVEVQAALNLSSKSLVEYHLRVLDEESTMPSFIGFTPTRPEHIDGFFELAPLSSSDIVYDLGSGDGRLLFAALDRGAGKAVGVELNPGRVRDARETARSKGLEGKITFLETDVMEISLADASVVLCYLSSSALVALKSKFESELRPGTRIVTESFPVPGWKPVRVVDKGYKQFYLYTIPPEFSEEYPASDVHFDSYWW